MVHSGMVYSLNGQRVRLGDRVWVVTEALKQSNRRIVVDPTRLMVVEGTLDSLTHSRTGGGGEICTGQAMCRVPVYLTGTVRYAMRMVTFEEKNCSPNEEDMFLRLDRMQKGRKEMLLEHQRRR